MAYRRVANPRMVPLAWVRTARRGAGASARPRSLGLWPHAPPTARTSKPMLRYAHQQGMISTRPGRSTSCSTTPTSATPAGSMDLASGPYELRRTASPTIRATHGARQRLDLLVGDSRRRAFHRDAKSGDRAERLQVAQGRRLSSLQRDGAMSLVVTPPGTPSAPRNDCPRRARRRAPTMSSTALRSSSAPSRSARTAGIAGLAFTAVRHRQPPSSPRCPPAPLGRQARVRRRRAPRPRRRSPTPARRPASPSAATRGSARDRAARHERGRAGGRAHVVHEDARRRGQFPPALRRAAQSGGSAVERTQHCRAATSSSPRSRRAIAASSRRSAAPSCSATPSHELSGQIRAAWCARWTRASRAAVPGVTDGRGLPRHQRGAGGGRATANIAIRRTSAGAATASASARSGRATCALDNDTMLRAGHGVHDPSEPASAGDRLPAVRRAGAADRAGAEPLTRRQSALAEIVL